MMFTKFIEKKVRTWFKMNNKKKDGTFGQSDYKEMADLFVSEFHLKDQKANDIRQWLENGWDALIKRGDEEASKKNADDISVTIPAIVDLNRKMKDGQKITEEEYIDAYKQLVEVDKNLFQEIFEKMVGCFFDVFDTDNDGFIGADDLVRGLKCFGISQADGVKSLFQEMDMTKKGKIDKKTYIENWVEFMLGEDKNAPIAKCLCR